MKLFDTEYRKLRALMALGLVVLLGLSVGVGCVIYQNTLKTKAQIKISEDMSDIRSLQVSLLKLFGELKDRPSPPKSLRYHVEPQKPPGAPNMRGEPTIQVPTATPGVPL